MVHENDTFWVPWQGEASRGKERRGGRRGNGTSAATTGNLLGINVQQKGRNCKEAATMAVGGLRRGLQGFNAGCSGYWFCGGDIATKQLQPPRDKEG